MPDEECTTEPLDSPDVAPAEDTNYKAVPLPSPQQFYFDLPLYEEVKFEAEQIQEYRAVSYFDDTFDTFCPFCEKHSIFKRSNMSSPPDRFDVWPSNGTYEAFFKCQRNPLHVVKFYVLAGNRSLQKIGQYPSLATLNLYDVRKYSGVLDKNRFRELTKAIGLSAHGVGVGSFVYLRRIFETLVEEAHRTAANKPEWDENAYSRFRMDEKINALKELLPPFLVENRSLYGILSKGIHELGEQECLAAFPVVKLGIEIILDGKLQMEAERKKLDEARAAIADLRRQTSQATPSAD
jgi:hypothetical protein